jgi:hypothetical protein
MDMGCQPRASVAIPPGNYLQYLLIWRFDEPRASLDDLEKIKFLALGRLVGSRSTIGIFVV